MIEYIGWIGLVLLLFAWMTQLTKWKRHFFFIVGVASLILAIHAIIISDVPFIIVNGFVALVSFVRAFKINFGMSKNGKSRR